MEIFVIIPEESNYLAIWKYLDGLVHKILIEKDDVL